MTTGQDESNHESGSEFRQKFEQTQQEAAALRALAAEQFGVSVEDLKGVAVDQIKAKAAEVLEARKAAEEQTLRAALEKRGLQGDDLDGALAQLLGKGGEQPAATQQQAPASSPFALAGQLQGTPPAAVQTEGLYGVDRILANLQSRSK